MSLLTNTPLSLPAIFLNKRPEAPLTITLGESDATDYAAVLRAMSAKEVDAEAIYALHSQLSPADLKATVARVLSKSEISTEALVSSIRDELVSVSAVAPEEVEPVDLADFPGLEGIKEELERNVLFPLENPDQAKKFGLTPKRGVLLHGQPGTGKTTVGRWLANRLKGKFFLVREMMLQAPAKLPLPEIIWSASALIYNASYSTVKINKNKS